MKPLHTFLRVLSGLALTVFSLVPILASAADEPYWPQWRGPDGQGHAPETADLPLTWSENENVTWKVEIPGRGHSSPVIQGNQIWMTTALETEADAADAAKRLEENTGNQPLTLLSKVSLRAVCVDRESGQIVQDVEVIGLDSPQWVHQLNSYASPTPVLDEGRLYCHFGTFGNACVDIATGQVLWSRTDLNIMHENGPGSTPVIWGDLMIFHLDGSDTQSIVALNKHSGELVWRRERTGEMAENPQQRKSYATPLVVEVDGKEQLISIASDWLYAYDPATGEELWKVTYGHLGFSIVPRPVFGHGLIYASTGFGKTEIMAIRPGSADGARAPEIVWGYNKAIPRMSSPILVGDELYFVNDDGIFQCLNAHTGEVNWQERVGGAYSASPLYANGRLYFFSREGVTTVLEPTPEAFRVLAENVLDGGAHMASAAVAENELYLRMDAGLYRIEKR